MSLYTKASQGPIHKYKKTKRRPTIARMNDEGVFSLCRKIVNDDVSRSARGRLFVQARGAATEKARSPRVDRRVVGTSSVDVHY